MPTDRISDVLDALPWTVIVTDQDATVVSVAGRGPRPAGLEGSVVQALSYAATRAEWAAAFERVRQDDTPPLRWEFPGIGDQQEQTWRAELTARRVQGAHAGYLICLTDVTEAHRARNALIATGLALASSIDLQRVYRELGMQLRQAVGCDAWAIAVADDETLALSIVESEGYGDDRAATEARLRPEWLQALATGSGTLHGAPGTRRELSAPIISEEGVIGAITVRPIAADGRHELEEARRILVTITAQTAAAIDRAFLVRRVEQKRRLEAVGEVAAGVAHELRNPLFGISSAAQLLRLQSGGTPAVERNLTRIQREVDRLNGMLSSLLEYGRPQPLVTTPMDPDLVWDEVLEANRARLTQAGLTLQRQRNRRPITARIDPAQFTQVCLNILVNAVDAAPAGTAISLHTGIGPNNTWRTRLHNGGPAIPAEALPRVFEIFFSMKSGGTGIGLALCQRIMEEHGGGIGIESQPETGTTVTLWLPAQVSAE